MRCSSASGIQRTAFKRPPQCPNEHILKRRYLSLDAFTRESFRLVDTLRRDVDAGENRISELDCLVVLTIDATSTGKSAESINCVEKEAPASPL